MADLRIPPNQIVSKYSSGNEYMFVTTQKEYKGYYYEINGKLFAGKVFNPNNPEIVKINSNKFNKLLGNASTYVYGVISGVKIPNVPFNSTPTTTLNTTDVIDASSSNMNDTVAFINDKNNITLKFYCKKVNQQPIIIKEIDENTYKSLQKDPLYQTTFVGTYQNKTQTADDAEKQVQGIKAFLNL